MWRNKNPEYFEEWRERNFEYFMKYQRLRRVIRDGEKFRKVLKSFLSFLCNCGEVDLSGIKRERFCIRFFCNFLCECNILLYEDFKAEGEFDRVIIFSNLNSLRNPENQLRCRRIFIYRGKEFKIKREMNLLPDFSKKKVLIITKSQKR